MKKMLVAAALLAVVLSACGSYRAGPAPAASPSPSPLTSATPVAGFDVVVTEKDQVVQLHTGQRLLVVLHAPSGMRPWSHPASGDHSILTPVVDPAAMAPLGVTVGAFQAVAPGEVQVIAVTGPNCLAGQACPMFAVEYTLRVSVTQ
ncbi:MAG: hypothetical protein ACHQ0J_05775 [Candidatus Dormibacterales bacterium]